MRFLLLPLFIVLLTTSCVRADPLLDLLNSVNGEVNTKINYVSDEDSHGVVDFWQKPEETVALGSGDCEDYAILKAYLLRNKEEVNSVSILITYSKKNSEYHATTLINNLFVLDNTTNEIKALHRFKEDYIVDKVIPIDEAYKKLGWLNE